MTQALALSIVLQFGCAKQRLEKMKPPTAQELFDRYDNLTSPDGTADWNNIYMSGKMEMPLMNASFPLESWVIKGSGTQTTYEIPNIGIGGQGYNLQYAWALDPVKGDRLLEGAEFAAAKSEYDSLLVDSFADLYRDSVVVKYDTVEEQNVWIVEVIEKATDKPSKLFFSIDTGLLIAQNKEIPSGKGSIKSKMYFEEYQSVEGTNMLMPVKIRVKVMGMTQYMIFESIKIDADNPPKIEPPESILEFIDSDTDSEKSSDSNNQELGTVEEENTVEETGSEDINSEQEKVEYEKKEEVQEE